MTFAMAGCAPPGSPILTATLSNSFNGQVEAAVGGARRRGPLSDFYRRPDRRPLPAGHGPKSRSWELQMTSPYLDLPLFPLEDALKAGVKALCATTPGVNARLS